MWDYRQTLPRTYLLLKSTAVFDYGGGRMSKTTGDGALELSRLLSYIDARMRWMDAAMHELDGSMTPLDVKTTPGINAQVYWALIVTAAVCAGAAAIILLLWVGMPQHDKMVADALQPFL
jgi:hypothetical protein